MTDHMKTLRELVAAGEKVNAGKWKRHPRAWCSAVAADSDNEWSGEILAATGSAQRNFKEDEQRVQQEARCDFVVSAANARPALAALLRVVEAAKATSVACKLACDAKGADKAVDGWYQAQAALDAALRDLEPEVEDGE